MKSVIALYDEVDKAQAAARALLTGGFSQSSIKLYVAEKDDQLQPLVEKTDYKIRLTSEGAKGLTHLYHMLMQFGVPEQEALLYCKEIETGRGSAFVAVYTEGEEVGRVRETLKGFGPTIANNLVSHWRLPRIVYFPFNLQDAPLAEGSLLDRELRSIEESLARMIAPRLRTSHLVFSEPAEEFEFVTPRLTPQYLRDTLAPYLEAIDQIQQLIDQMQGIEVVPMRILSITESSAVDVTIEGALQVLQWLSESLLPRRNLHPEEESYWGEKRTEVQMASALISRLAPWLSKGEQMSYVMKLLPPVHVLLTSELIVRIES